MAEKKLLFDGCARSQLTVTPNNWESDKATTLIPWRITYRFYDPATKGTKDWGKQIPIYDMNAYKDLKDRQRITKKLKEQEEELLDVKGYNPITGQYMAQDNAVFEIHPETPFVDALREGLKKLDVVEDVRTDIGYIVNGLEKSARVLFDADLG